MLPNMAISALLFCVIIYCCTTVYQIKDKAYYNKVYTIQLKNKIHFVVLKYLTIAEK